MITLLSWFAASAGWHTNGCTSVQLGAGQHLVMSGAAGRTSAGIETTVAMASAGPSSSLAAFSCGMQLLTCRAPRVVLIHLGNDLLSTSLHARAVAVIACAAIAQV
eukprot:4916791-Amphidinium_carterae.1